MTKLKIGDVAPAFEGTNQKNEKINSDKFRGKKVVLFFYPKASTPGCTLEACNLRDNHERFLTANYVVIGVSADSVKSQANFAEKQHLPYSLIADEDKKIIQAYGVWGPKKFMGREFDGILRTTFIIDENGLISDIISKVDTKQHTNQILK